MLLYYVNKSFSHEQYYIQAEKIILLRVLIIIIYSVYTARSYLYMFFKDILKCSEYIYYNVYCDSNFLKIDF